MSFGGRAGQRAGLLEPSADMVSLLILLRPLLHHAEAGTVTHISTDCLSALIAHGTPVRWKQALPLLLPLTEIEAYIEEWAMQVPHSPEKWQLRRRRTEKEAYDRLIRGLNLSVQRKAELSGDASVSPLPHAGMKARELSGSRRGPQVKLGLWLAEHDARGIRLTDLQRRFDNRDQNTLEELGQEIGYRLESSLFMRQNATRTSCILPISFLEHARDKAQASWAADAVDRLMASRQTDSPWPAVIVLRRLKADTSGAPIGDDAALEAELLHVMQCRHRRAERRKGKFMPPRKRKEGQRSKPGEKPKAMRFDELRSYLDPQPRKLDSHDWRLTGW